jgi:hypothetical protein
MYPLDPSPPTPSKQHLSLKPSRDAGKQGKIKQVVISRQNLHKTRIRPGLAHGPTHCVLWKIPVASLWLRSGGTAGSQSLWQRWLWFLMPREPRLSANLRAQTGNKYQSQAPWLPWGYLILLLIQFQVLKQVTEFAEAFSPVRINRSRTVAEIS